MLYFENDYCEGAHPAILQKLTETNFEKVSGYGTDPYCASAKEKIRAACACPEADVSFISGGTQTNAIVIASLLHRWEGVLAAATGHVAGHEAGAIEFTGHKVIGLPQKNGTIFGELVPKRIGMAMAEKVSKAVARPMKALSLVAAPLVWLLSKSTALVTKAIGLKESENKVTEEEIKAIVREGMDTGEVQAVEHDIVERVFSLGDRDVDSIMTHRSELVWLDTNDSAEEILRKVCADMHDVYPVSDGRPDELAGAAHMKDLFGNIHRPDFRLSSILKPANCLPENQSVYEALEEFKRTNSAYGFIIDEFGDVLGIVTLRDMMEALVGEVPDEDEEAEMVRREDGSWLVDGQCSFYNFLEQFDREELYRDNEYNTLSGLLLDELKHIPSTGETLSWNGFRFEIVDMDGARIDKVLVHYAAPAPDGTLS